MPTRKARIASYSINERPVVFSEAQRRQIENDCRYPEMSDRVWSEIEEATSLLATHAPAALRAAEASDVVELLKKFLSAGNALRQSIYGTKLNDESSVISSLQDIESNYFATPRSHLSIDAFYASFGASLDGALALSAHLKQNLARANNEFSPPLLHWKIWIGQLTKIMQKNNLPFRISKDLRSSPSAFVFLVRELQKCLPKECRQYDSDDAIAQAIYRARVWFKRVVYSDN
jgi:hypothetical protein